MGHPVAVLVVLCGTRLAYRFAKTAARRARAGALRPPATREVPVLLYGAGPLAALYVGAVRSTPRPTCGWSASSRMRARRAGATVHDVPVLGGPHDLDRIVAELAVQGIHPERLVLTRPPSACRRRYARSLSAAAPATAWSCTFCPTCRACPQT